MCIELALFGVSRGAIEMASVLFLFHSPYLFFFLSVLACWDRAFSLLVRVELDRVYELICLASWRETPAFRAQGNEDM